MRSWFNPGSAFDDHHEGADASLAFLLKPFCFIVLIWIIFWLDERFSLDLYQLGIMPRHLDGLVGVLTSPLVHGSLSHLANNTMPILVLGSGLYYFYPKIGDWVVLGSWLGSGLTVWLIARENYHIGASGIIYALAGFIFLSGLMRRQINLLALSLLVAFLYGSLVWGLLPIEERISYEAHAAGAGSGLLLALVFRKSQPNQRKKYSWEKEEQEEDEVLARQIEKYGDEYWKQHNDADRPVRIKYHYKPKKRDNSEE